MGSFYNVLGIRLPKKKSIVKPGSHCPKCEHTLSWYENIPIISYLFLLGKCKACKKQISIMYPAIELLTGILFATSYLLFGMSENLLIAIVLVSLLVLIFITDALYMIILDEALIFSSILIFVVKIIYNDFMYALISVGYGIFIFGLVYLLMLLGNYLFKKESLGGGDIKLSFVAGLVLGPYLGIFYLALASFLAFPYAVFVSIKNEDGMLPFGPFLVTSLYLCFCNSEMIMEFLRRLIGVNG